MPRITSDLIIPLQEALKGRYWLERELGRGGMGIVYLAEEVALDRMVALKLLPPRQDRFGRRERFLREARTAARLSHPNIVPIHTVDEVEDFVFFTMAYVEGETLARRVRERGPLPIDEATRVLREVAWAVDYGHGQGVIHRDLKAENIMLERESGRAMVMDFGIAVVKQDPPSVEGLMTFAGTPQYMSPEHVKGLEVDERSDVYSLGIVGYFAASGTLPFTGTRPQDIAMQQIRSPAPRLVIGDASKDRALVWAVKRCMAKDPIDRFQTAAHLAQELEERDRVPVPLRIFVKRLRLSLYSGTAFSLVGVLALLQLISAISLGQSGSAAVAGGFVAFVLAAAVAFLVPPTRRVLQAGYDRADIVQALEADLERQQEELAFQFGKDAGPTERIARAATFAGLGLFGFGATAALIGTSGLGIALGSMVVGAATTAFAGFVAASNHERRSDRAGMRWLRFWNSRFGVWTAKVAGFGLKRLPAGAASHAHGTDSALVMAIDRMFQNLPDPPRLALEDLPDVLRRLAVQTYDTQVFLAESEASQTSAEDIASAVQRIAETETALEAIHLALRRLEDGDGTVEGVTAELDVAREIADAVDRVLEGREEVEEG